MNLTSISTLVKQCCASQGLAKDLSDKLASVVEKVYFFAISVNYIGTEHIILGLIREEVFFTTEPDDTSE